MQIQNINFIDVLSKKIVLILEEEEFTYLIFDFNWFWLNTNQNYENELKT